MKWSKALALVLGATWASAGLAEVHVVELRGVIHPVSASYLTDAIDRADEASADALVIEIDTPGGLVESTRGLAQRIIDAKTPVIGFVTPAAARAASGGFLLLLACDVAAMSPGTNTGAAHPVTIGTENRKDDIGLKKAESDLAAFARSVAEKRGRDVKLAESGVTESVSWTEKEALAGKLIEVIARDLKELLATLDGRSIRRWSGEETVLNLGGPIVRARAMSTVEQFQNFLLKPEIAAFLLGLGLLGIYIEMTHPGLIFPGAVGVGSLLLFAYAAHILPVSFLGLLLIATSILLFILEIKFVSHGLLGIGAVICLVAGSLMLFEGPIPELRLPVGLVLPTSLALAAVMFLVVRYVIRAHLEQVSTGQEGMVGKTGVATTDLAPEGKIFVHGEIWSARAEQTIPRGTRVRIRAVEEMCVLVEPERREG